jgi:uncharacterized membrane protein
MRTLGHASIFLTLLVVFSFAQSGFAQYKFTTVDFAGAAQTEVIAVNDAGQYVGASIDADTTNHAIYFDGKTFSKLDPNGPVGTNYSFALSLNLRGDIVGGYFDASNVAHGFLYNGGKVTNIDYPGATGTFAYGVNDSREIIGVYADTAQVQHAFILRKGVYKNIDLPGGVLTVPFSINGFSQVVGEFEDAAGEPVGHGYLQAKNGKFTTYDAPGAPANSTFFISINSFDLILGTWIDGVGLNHNFLLSFAGYQTFDLPKSLHATNVSAQTINDFGEIVGYYFDAQQVQHGFLAIPKGGKQAR